MTRKSSNPRVTTIKQKVVIPAKPEEVFEAFIDAKKHAVFTGGKATSDPKVGGEFTAWDGYIFGKHLELTKGKKIVQEWKTTEWPEGYPPSRFELTLTPTSEGTEISMIHSGVPREQADEIKQGWIDYYWNPLKKHFSK